MKRKNIMLSEFSRELQKDKYYSDFTYMRQLESSNSETETRMVGARSWEEGKWGVVDA